MTKTEIRDAMRARRSQADAATRRTASRAIAVAVLARREFGCARAVACYLSLPQEIDTAEILATCHDQGKEVCVPAWDAATRTYILARLTPGQPLRTGPHGVPEPVAWQVVAPETVALAVVPGLAFDRHGGRLGYGKGYYDRILAVCAASCVKAGVGYAWQVVADDLPLTSRDVRMDLLVTEQGVIECGPGRAGA